MTGQTDRSELSHWKKKYFDQLEKLELKEAEWNKSEKLLSSALSRLSLLAEKQAPELSKHLKGMRVVLKEKFSLYRVESLLEELFQLLTRYEKESASRPPRASFELRAFVDLLENIEFPKSLEKNRKAFIKQVKSSGADLTELLPAFQALLNAKPAAEPEPRGLLSRLFSKPAGDGSSDAVIALASLLNALPWPESLSTDAARIAASFKTVNDDSQFITLLEELESVASQWKPLPEPLGRAVEKEDVSKEQVRQNCLKQFVEKLQELNPSENSLQVIEPGDDVDAGIDRLATKMAELLAAKADLLPVRESPDSTPLTGAATLIPDDLTRPEIREVLIQLLERIVVPIALMDKVDALKQFLESDDGTQWQSVLKRVAHFINEVHIYQYQEEDGYEAFLQQITSRLQEIVQFIETENRALSSSSQRGNELNQAVANEVNELRLGIENAADMAGLQSLVNQRLDAISNYMMQQREHEKSRYDDASENLRKMQQKINELEQEAFDLKLKVEEKNREAMYDALTGVPNRLFYEKRVSEDIARWKRFKTPLSLAIWDVDKFKSVNDTYGHKAGDKVLKTVAKILQKRIRETDFLARYGGEEFVMLLPGTVEEETLRLANELRQSVSECAFHYNKEAVVITISCGISGFREGDTLSQVFERADKALYRAKHSGRNRCVVAGLRTTD